MKKIVIFLLVFFSSLGFSQNYSPKELSDTSVAVITTLEKADTLYEANGIIKIVNTETRIPTDVIKFPKDNDLGYYRVFSMFINYKRMGKQDSSCIYSWDTVVYRPEYGFLVKTEKSVSKCAYLDVERKHVFIKEFRKENTILSPGMVMSASTFTLFLFLGTLFSKAHQKREGLGFEKHKTLWTYVSYLFCFLLVLLVVSGVVLGASDVALFGSIFFAFCFFLSPFERGDKSMIFMCALLCVCCAGLFSGVPKSIELFFITIFITGFVYALGRIVPTPKFLLRE